MNSQNLVIWFYSFVMAYFIANWFITLWMPFTIFSCYLLPFFLFHFVILHTNNISKSIYSSPGILPIKILYIFMRFTFTLNKVFDQRYWLSLKYIQQYRWSKILASAITTIFSVWNSVQWRVLRSDWSKSDFYLLTSWSWMSY